jgi:type I restriction enzyme S subunit
MADEWRETPLSALCSYLNRGAAPAYTETGGLLVLNQKCVRDQRVTFDLARRTDSERKPVADERLLRPLDILVNSTGVGTLGRVAQVRELPEPATFDSHVTVIRPDPREVDPLYLGMAIRSIESDIEKLGEGSTGQTELARDRLGAFTVHVPSREEQQAIAHILGTLDDKIELNRRMNETLEAMARALFKSWFLDFDPVRAKAAGLDHGLPEPIADLFPDSFEDSELGAIPKGWKVATLDHEITELEVGGRPKGGVSAYTEGVPSIGAESIVGLGRFDYSKTKYVPLEYFQSMKKGHVKSRDVLLYKDGGRPGEYEPHVTLVGDGFPFDTCAINEHVYRLRAKSTIGQNFLFFWLSSDLVMDEMRTKGTGVAIPGLNSTQVKSLTTLVPSSDVIGAFDDIADRLVARVLAVCNESRTLAALRDTLLPKLVSGELRVETASSIVSLA